MLCAELFYKALAKILRAALRECRFGNDERPTLAEIQVKRIRRFVGCAHILVLALHLGFACGSGKALLAEHIVLREILERRLVKLARRCDIEKIKPPAEYEHAQQNDARIDPAADQHGEYKAHDEHREQNSENGVRAPGQFFYEPRVKTLESEHNVPRVERGVEYFHPAINLSWLMAIV